MAVRESTRVGGSPAPAPELFVVLVSEGLPPDHIEGMPVVQHVFEFSRLEAAFDLAMRLPWQGLCGQIEVWLGRSRCLHSTTDHGPADLVGSWSGPAAPGRYAVSFDDDGEVVGCSLLGAAGGGIDLLEAGRYAGAL